MATDLWTIEQLGAAVAVALAGGNHRPPNGRVREVPDLRTIRYYTTLGLLDRPAAMRGRTALYGRRHLLQLVAIKRLQSRGLSLAEVQERLVGATNSTLARWADVPKDLVAPEADEATARAVAPRRFWAEPAALPPAPVEVAPPAEATAALQGIPLADDVVLLLPPARAIDDDDLPAIRAAAAPLLHLLHKRRLLGPRPKGEPHDEPPADPAR